jgi:hypothetical protein
VPTDQDEAFIVGPGKYDKFRIGVEDVVAGCGPLAANSTTRNTRAIYGKATFLNIDAVGKGGGGNGANDAGERLNRTLDARPRAAVVLEFECARVVPHAVSGSAPGAVEIEVTIRAGHDGVAEDRKRVAGRGIFELKPSVA